MSLSKWDQLPSLDLYLDQVLLYIQQETQAYRSQHEKNLTASMINNYVKQGYLQKPVKKKYGRKQIARLIVLTICKTVFSISDISQMIDVYSKEMDSQILYNTFVDCLEGQVQADTPELIIKACQTIRVYKETMELVNQLKKEK